MLLPWRFFVAVMVVMACTVEGRPRRILWDTDVGTDDLFGILYLLKLNRSEFQLEVIANLIPPSFLCFSCQMWIITFEPFYSLLVYYSQEYMKY